MKRVVWLLALFAARPVSAHPLSPALLELEQGADATHFAMRWKTTWRGPGTRVTDR